MTRFEHWLEEGKVGICPRCEIHPLFVDEIICDKCLAKEKKIKKETNCSNCHLRKKCSGECRFDIKNSEEDYEDDEEEDE